MSQRYCGESSRVLRGRGRDELDEATSNRIRGNGTIERRRDHGDTPASAAETRPSIFVVLYPCTHLGADTQGSSAMVGLAEDESRPVRVRPD